MSLKIGSYSKKLNYLNALLQIRFIWIKKEQILFQASKELYKFLKNININNVFKIIDLANRGNVLKIYFNQNGTKINFKSYHFLINRYIKCIKQFILYSY